MEITIKNNTELLNIMYGDNEDYSYITNEDMDTILDDKIQCLEDLYEDTQDGDILDIINLVSEYKKVKVSE